MTITETQHEIDNGVKQQENVIKVVLKKLGHLDHRKSTRLYIQKLRNSAHETQIRAWTRVWSVTSESLVCSGEHISCVQTNDYQLMVDDYLSDARLLDKMLKGALKKLKRAGADAKVAKRLRQRGKKLLKENTTRAESIPPVRLECV